MWVAFLPLCMLYSSYSNCGNHNLNFWLMCFWNLYNKCCINIELFSLIFTKIKSICNRYCFNLWKKYFINIAQGMAKMRSVIHFCSVESASLPHCHVSCSRAFIAQKVLFVPRPLLHVYLLRKCKAFQFMDSIRIVGSNWSYFFLSVQNFCSFGNTLWNIWLNLPV